VFLRPILLAIGIFTIAAGFAYYTSSHPMDFRVYHYGARGVFDGTRPVYGAASGLGWPMHYRYPPLFLLLFAPLAALPLGWGAAIWVTLKIIVLIVLLRVMRCRLQPAGARSPSWSFCIVFLFITPYLVEEFRYGNAQFFVVALTAASLLVARERPVLSAASLALAVCVKVWPVFFVPYLVVRRDWQVVAYTLGFVVFLTLLPSFYFGFHDNLNLLGQWFSQESQTQLGSREIWFPNQSLRGVLMRYLTVIDYSQVPDSNYQQIHIAELDPELVRALWIVVAAAVYIAFLVFAGRRRHTDGRLEHGLAFCLLALLEPFTQKYALAVLLWPALISGSFMAIRYVRLFMYIAAALALIQPLTPGSAAQRLFQVLGLDFAAALLLTLAILAACWKSSNDDALPA